MLETWTGLFINLTRYCIVACRDLFLLKLKIWLIFSPQNFWKFLRSREDKPDMPGCMKFNGVSSSDGETVVNLFCGFFFVEVYSGDIVVPNRCEYERTININICQFSTLVIFEMIWSRKHKISSGPDRVPNYLLRWHSSGLFNMLLRSGIFSTVWKFSYVIPLLKKGERSDIENYRVICFVSTIPKLLHSLVSKYSAWHSLYSK